MNSTRHHSSSAPELRRQQQRDLRLRVLAFCRWSSACGWSRGQSARRLGLRPRALQRWQRSWRREHLPVIVTGRPSQAPDPVAHEEVLQLLDELGPQTGLPTLQALFPAVPRRELGRIKSHFLDLWQAGNVPSVLRWLVPGTAWAWDFTTPLHGVLIDGCYPYLLVVWDLASHYRLLAQPAEHQSLDVAAAALEILFRTHGTPLVGKQDNGSHFGPLLQRLLEQHGVTCLWSPVYTPQYNGAIEAQNTPLKLRAHYQAIRHGRIGCWSSDDVEAARIQANTVLRPWGPKGPTPAELWQQRLPISAASRQEFLALVHDHQQRILAAKQRTAGGVLDGSTQTTLARVAVRRALVELGLLLVQRG